jgi:hypothetical protein
MLILRIKLLMDTMINLILQNNYYLPRTARRPKVADVALLAAAVSKRFNQFSLNCATDPVTQG